MQKGCCWIPLLRVFARIIRIVVEICELGHVVRSTVLRFSSGLLSESAGKEPEKPDSAGNLSR